MVLRMKQLWAHGRDLAGWSWRFEELTCGNYGVTDFDSKTVTIDSRLDYGAWRSTVHHELLHVLRGPCDDDRAKEERLVEQMAAIALISLDDLRSVRHLRSMREQAAQLRVDRKLIKTRWRTLSDAEKAWLEFP